MLKELHTEGIGLEDRIDILFGDRLNIFTGDNGLGKSFILDLVWWVLTESWFDTHAYPKLGSKVSPCIIAEMTSGANKQDSSKYLFSGKIQNWEIEKSSKERPDIVIYAGVDGNFAVWDSLRKESSGQYLDVSFLDVPPRAVPITYKFNKQTLWNGLKDNGTGKVRCNGLIQDLIDWQYRQKETSLGELKHSGFLYLQGLLGRLAPPGEQMRPGDVRRLSLDDVREIPTLAFSYGEVPITLCSAAIQRILGLAYLMIWSWLEHLEAAKLMQVQPGNHVVMIMDEVELHLHPKWQRHILPALISAMNILDQEAKVQIIATTHAPLVLASLEPHFREHEDKLFVFNQMDQRVSLTDEVWAEYGDISNWLTSGIFGLPEARSVEAQKIIKEAQAFMVRTAGKNPELIRDEATRIERTLLTVLSEEDPFWSEWIINGRKKINETL